MGANPVCCLKQSEKCAGEKPARRARVVTVIRWPTCSLIQRATASISSLSPPNGSHKLILNVDHPELWWPNGHGDQTLYRLELFCGGEALHDGQIGFSRRGWLCSLVAPGQRPKHQPHPGS